MTDMELKPCPFCGGEAMVDGPEEHIAPGIGISYSVFCSNDDCYLGRMDSPGFYQWLHEAAAAWNTRAAVTPEQFAQAVHGGRAWEPVRTCRWELVKRGTVYDVYGCSACGYEYAEPVTDGGVLVSIGDASYCPNCGAKVVSECER